MPRLTRTYLKVALVYFVAALLLGVLLAVRGLLAMPPALGVLGPVYLHLLMLGWVSQLIFGVVFWMFPKASPERPRGSERLGWATFWLLNVGLVLRAASEPWAALSPGGAPGTLLALSAVLQLLAGWGFVANTWPRVKER
jgi:cbb3-type cytochrome oxidase subunit 1